MQPDPLLRGPQPDQLLPSPLQLDALLRGLQPDQLLPGPNLRGSPQPDIRLRGGSLLDPIPRNGRQLPDPTLLSGALVCGGLLPGGLVCGGTLIGGAG
ncbi:hypothetical protein ACFVAV_19230 [Nocardia sp. NPDC057663]|uniref:hypothetical protein n=1 Tax=Nocardia sp. NPDC057663 TaxID=3346201 RepID=UPI00366B3EAC